jgi:hypothetical protein
MRFKQGVVSKDHFFLIKVRRCLVADATSPLVQPPRPLRQSN